MDGFRPGPGGRRSVLTHRCAWFSARHRRGDLDALPARQLLDEPKAAQVVGGPSGVDRQQRTGTWWAARDPGLAGDAVSADPGGGARCSAARRHPLPPGMAWPCRAGVCNPALRVRSVARRAPASAARGGGSARDLPVLERWSDCRGAVARAACRSRGPRAACAACLRHRGAGAVTRDELYARLLRASFEQYLAPDVVRRSLPTRPHCACRARCARSPRCSPTSRGSPA